MSQQGVAELDDPKSIADELLAETSAFGTRVRAWVRKSVGDRRRSATIDCVPPRCAHAFVCCFLCFSQNCELRVRVLCVLACVRLRVARVRLRCRFVCSLGPTARRPRWSKCRRTRVSTTKSSGRCTRRRRTLQAVSHVAKARAIHCVAVGCWLRAGLVALQCQHLILDASLRPVLPLRHCCCCRRRYSLDGFGG